MLAIMHRLANLSLKASFFWYLVDQSHGWYPLRPSMLLVAGRQCCRTVHRTVEVTSCSGSSLHHSAEQTSDKKTGNAVPDKSEPKCCLGLGFSFSPRWAAIALVAAAISSARKRELKVHDFTAVTIRVGAALHGFQNRSGAVASRSVDELDSHDLCMLLRL